MEAKEDEEEILLDRFLEREDWETRPLSQEERAALARGIAAFTSAPEDVGHGRQRLSGTIESTARRGPRRQLPNATRPPSAG